MSRANAITAIARTWADDAEEGDAALISAAIGSTITAGEYAQWQAAYALYAANLERVEPHVDLAATAETKLTALQNHLTTAKATEATLRAAYASARAAVAIVLEREVDSSKLLQMHREFFTAIDAITPMASELNWNLPNADDVR